MLLIIHCSCSPNSAALKLNRIRPSVGSDASVPIDCVDFLNSCLALIRHEHGFSPQWGQLSGAWHVDVSRATEHSRLGAGCLVVYMVCGCLQDGIPGVYKLWQRPLCRSNTYPRLSPHLILSSYHSNPYFLFPSTAGPITTMLDSTGYSIPQERKSKSPYLSKGCELAG